MAISDNKMGCRRHKESKES